MSQPKMNVLYRTGRTGAGGREEQQWYHFPRGITSFPASYRHLPPTLNARKGDGCRDLGEGVTYYSALLQSPVGHTTIRRHCFIHVKSQTKRGGASTSGYYGRFLSFVFFFLQTRVSACDVVQTKPHCVYLRQQIPRVPGCRCVT